ncbi:MAG: GNAT family N-acetyltransferase [Ruminococcus sp.]|jgi:RimJ/RimL family protein N-acetyltransferase
MLKIKKMLPQDETAVLPMVNDFYHSDAVDHQVDMYVLRRTFQDAVSDECPSLWGVTLWDDDRLAGFAYLTSFYACEVGGITIMLEEIYLDDSCRGKGYGTEFFQWMFREYPQARRFRLEVTGDNERASRLYEKLGFTFMSYRQMIKDRNC